MRRAAALLTAIAFGGLSIAANAAEKREIAVSQKFRPLADQFFVSPQIDIADVAAAKALGVTLIINNRPDREEPGQPAGAEIEAAAKAAGIAYVAIPVSGMSIGPAELDAFDKALAAQAANGEDGATLAYCRSGTRSTVLHAFARARQGDSADAVIDEAMDAGYNISGQRNVLIALGAI